MYERNDNTSEEFFIVEYGTDPTRKIVYAPLRSYLGLVPTSAANILLKKDTTNLKKTFIAMLNNRKYINMNEVLQNLHEATPELSLAITDNCNLRCVYCHASAGEPHKKNTMSKQTISAIMDSYFNFVSSAKYISINFNGGGEPSFAFEELNYSITYARKIAALQNKNVSFTMATNGFYGDFIRQYVIDNFLNVSLSLDGPDFIQNKHRPTVNGGASFQTVYDTAKFFYKSGFPFAFRATVSKFSMPYLKSIIDFISDEFPEKAIGLEHLNPFGRGRMKIDNDVTPPNQKDFGEAIASLIDYAKTKKVTILNSASTEFNLLRPVHCSNIGIPNWTVTTKGQIVACERDNAPEEFVFGTIEENSGRVVLDNDKINKLHKYNVLEYEECKNCFCKYHCAGDCPDRRLADKSDCDSIKHIAKKVLKDIVDGVDQQSHKNYSLRK